MGLGIEERYDEFLKACQANDLELVEDLIFDRKFRLDVNRPLKDGTNAIIIAAQEDKYQLVKLLLLNGADANSKIPNGWNVLMLASRTGNYDTCKLPHCGQCLPGPAHRYAIGDSAGQANHV